MYNSIKLPRSRKYGSNYSVDKSVKIRRQVEFYSDLEYDHWILTETDPNVLNFCEQPDAASFILRGSKDKTIFDMWVDREGQDIQEFVEVKYDAELKEGHKNYERNMLQQEVQREWCAQNGYKYTLVTDKEIRANPILLSNKKKIHSLLKHMSIANADLYPEIFTRIPLHHKTLSFIDLTQLLPELTAYQLQELVAFHIYNGKLDSNIQDVPFGNKTEVRLWK